MSDVLRGIAEDVSFDQATAEKLSAAFSSAASLVEGQAGSRDASVTAALVHFSGRFADVFRSNAQVASADATKVVESLRKVAEGADLLAEEARKEQRRRVVAREWKQQQEQRNWLEKGAEALFGTESPPVGPAANPVGWETPAPTSSGTREIPFAGGGVAGGVSSADPDDLRTFADSVRARNHVLEYLSGTLRGCLTDFATLCRWGTLSADGVVGALDSWLAANEADANWSRTLAHAFAAAGGEGVVSTLSDSALAATLAAAGVSVSRQDLTIDPPQVFGAAPTSGYADDPVNTATGNFIEPEVDLAFGSGAATLAFGRMYNSLSGEVGGFGPGWASMAEMRLHLSDEAVIFVTADGRHMHFPRSGEGWDRAIGGNWWLNRELSEGVEIFVVSDNAGGRWEFSTSGRWLGSRRGPGTGVRAERDEVGRLVGITHERSRSVSIEWVGERIVVLLASDGRRVEYGYDNYGRLSAVRGPAGIRQYRWNDRGVIDAVVDASGVLAVENIYDASGRVAVQRSAFGRLTRFAYLPGRITVVSDQNGARSNSWISDAKGRIVGIVDAHDQRQSMSYDAHGNLISVTTRDKSVTAHSYDERGRRIRTMTASDAEVSYGYDEFDRVTAVVAESGAITSYEYADSQERNPSVIVDPEGGRSRLTWSQGLLTQVVDPVGVTLRFEYDQHGELVACRDALGGVARLERDTAGRVLAAISPSGARTEYRYDDSGALVSRRDAEGATWRYERGPGGRLVAIIDPLGARTEMEYGEHGEVIRTVDPLGRAIGREFDDLGNVVEATLPDGEKWSFVYDALSRLVESVDPGGHSWLREYDREGALVATVDPTQVLRTVTSDGSSVIVADAGASTKVFSDPLGRPTRVEEADGSGEVTVYDRCGRPVEVLDPDGGLTLLRRDEAGRVVEVVSPSGAVTRAEYDPCGRRSAVIEPSGALTRFEYDADGRQIRKIGPTGDVERIDYDRVGRVIARHTPGRGVSRFGYDPLGRVVRTRDSVYGLRRFRYDAAGQLVEAINGVGGVTRYGYDERGRNTTIVDPLGGVTRREFDANDHVVAQTDPLGRTALAKYDAAGRLIAQQEPDGALLEWAYDRAGRETTLHVNGRLSSSTVRDLPGRTATVTESLPSGDTVEHVVRFDRRDRLVERTRNGRGLRWEYDANGARSAVIGPDGARTVYERTKNGQISAVEHPRLGRVEFHYDASGRLLETMADGVVHAFSYTNGFLTRHNRTGRDREKSTTLLDRDADGRITGIRSDDRHTSYEYDGAHQLIAARSSDGSDRTWRYDRAGRLVGEMTPLGVCQREYDAAGQLVRSTLETANSAVVTTDYDYDLVGRRTSSVSSRGDRCHYAWSAEGHLAALAVSGPDTVSRVMSVHVDALGELAWAGSSELWWDRAADYGAPLLAIDDIAVVAGIGDGWQDAGWRGQRATRVEDPWVGGVVPGVDVPGGLAVSSSGDLFVGGVEWLGARGYDSVTRSFVSRDPEESVAGAGWFGNPYSYAGNDPLHSVDPTGLSPVTDAEFSAYAHGSQGLVMAFAQGEVDWWSNNWQYVAAGAAIAVGLFLMCTCVGGPVGMVLLGAAGGALVSAGADTAVQKATTGTVDWGHVGASAAVGALGGAVGGGAAFAASKAGASAVQAALAGQIADGAASGGAGYLTEPGPHTPAGLLKATATSVATGAVGGAAGRR
ncbi:DUF6531 domain-containing protein, partial [Rathayibacter toxicus]